MLIFIINFSPIPSYSEYPSSHSYIVSPQVLNHGILYHYNFIKLNGSGNIYIYIYIYIYSYIFLSRFQRNGSIIRDKSPPSLTIPLPVFLCFFPSISLSFLMWSTHLILGLPLDRFPSSFLCVAFSLLSSILSSSSHAQTNIFCFFNAFLFLFHPSNHILAFLSLFFFVFLIALKIK